MNRSTSIYLDFVRFFAAVLVYLHHLAYDRITGNTYAALGAYGEDAVMIFFVLSGYVIAHVAAEKENTPRDYFVSRLARLYSVVIPALVLTVMFDYIGQHTDPSLYAGWYEHSYPLIRLIVSLGFVNQIWGVDIHYFSNGPYWSISYEFWYYALFGIAMFWRGGWRWALLIACALIVGPGILLLAPIWLMGVWVYRFNSRRTVSAATGWLLFVAPVVAYIAFRYFEVEHVLTTVTDGWISPITNPMNLHKSRFFVSYLIVGALVSMNFIGANALAKAGILTFDRTATAIRFVAGYTFSLYLLHFPLLHALAALSPWAREDARHHVLVIAGSVVVIYLVGNITEKKKHVWKKALLAIWNQVASRCGRLAPKSSTIG